MTEPVLSVRDLKVRFALPGRPPLRAVRGVSFDLRPGERLGLVGESGCGKSTLAMAILGLLPPTAEVSGEVRVEGRELLALDERARDTVRWTKVAMVFQGAMSSLNPVVRVEDQIVEVLSVHRVARGRAARERAGELLEQVGIPARRGRRYPHEFSGGMRQRAAIAMALACSPRVLLADEPTTALDVLAQAQILELLERLSEQLGLAVVLVSHDLGVIAQSCHRAAVMYAGEIMECSDADAVFARPRHPYARMLVRATPTLDDGEPIAAIPGAPPRLDARLDGCPFTPRCPHAFEPCRDERPSLAARGGEGAVACHLYRSAPAVAAPQRETA